MICVLLFSVLGGRGAKWLCGSDWNWRDGEKHQNSDQEKEQIEPGGFETNFCVNRIKQFWILGYHDSVHVFLCAYIGSKAATSSAIIRSLFDFCLFISSNKDNYVRATTGFWGFVSLSRNIRVCYQAYWHPSLSVINKKKIFISELRVKGYTIKERNPPSSSWMCRQKASI